MRWGFFFALFFKLLGIKMRFSKFTYLNKARHLPSSLLTYCRQISLNTWLWRNFLFFGFFYQGWPCRCYQILAACSEVLPSWLASLYFLEWYFLLGEYVALAFGDIVFIQRYSLEILVRGQQNVQHFWFMLWRYLDLSVFYRGWHTLMVTKPHFKNLRALDEDSHAQVTCVPTKASMLPNGCNITM